jgi:hypothetical protein
MSLIERRLAEECDRYGLPHDLDALLKHVYANRDLSLAFKDQSIETLTEQLRGAVDPALCADAERWIERYEHGPADGVNLLADARALLARFIGGQ